MCRAIQIIPIPIGGIHSFGKEIALHEGRESLAENCTVIVRLKLNHALRLSLSPFDEISEGFLLKNIVLQTI